MGYDPHDYTTWEWRAAYREASREHGYDGEWQIAAYPGGGNSPLHVASAQGGHAPEDERAAHLLAAAPELYRALVLAKTRLLVAGDWTPDCAELIDAALWRAQGHQTPTERAR